MSRVLSILGKDARHLWPHIAVFVTLLALGALLDPTYTSHDPSAFSLLSSLLPLACWSLVIAAIHEEKLTGDRQYWLTRPLSWKELLAAKALFVAAFLNLPILVCHMATLAAVGVPLGEHLPALLWRQVFFTAFYVLPVAVLAAISRNIGQVILTAILIALPATVLQEFLLARLRVYWGDVAWMLTAGVALIVAAGAGAALAIQYSRRRTWLARMIAAAATIAVWGVTFIPARGTARSGPVRISLDSRRRRPSEFQPNGQNTIALGFPVRVDGIPAGAEIVKNRLTLRLEDLTYTEGGLHVTSNGDVWLSAAINRSVFLASQNKAVTLTGSFDFTLFAKSQALPVPRESDVVVPRLGVCSRGENSIVCLTPFPQVSLYLGKPGRGANWIVPQGFVGQPVPTAAGFEPLTRFSTQLPITNWDEIGDAQLIAGRPLGQLRVPFEFRGVRLREYAGEFSAR